MHRICFDSCQLISIEDHVGFHESQELTSEAVWLLWWPVQEPLFIVAPTRAQALTYAGLALAHLEEAEDQQSYQDGPKFGHDKTHGNPLENKDRSQEFLRLCELIKNLIGRDHSVCVSTLVHDIEVGHLRYVLQVDILGTVGCHA